jgi:hypothetical protein
VPARKSSHNPAAAGQTSENIASTSAKMSITSPSLAILALVAFWPVMGAWQVIDDLVVLIVAAVAGLIFGVAAVVTGVVVRRRVRRGEASRGRVALAGIVLGVVALVGPAIFLALFVAGEFYHYDQFQGCLKGSGYPKRYCLQECPDFFESFCHKQTGW